MLSGSHFTAKNVESVIFLIALYGTKFYGTK